MRKFINPCPHCKKPMLLTYEQKSKVTAMGIKKAREAGKSWGRPRTVNYDSIKELRETGLSYRKIASKLNCHIMSVRRALGKTNH